MKRLALALLCAVGCAHGEPRSTAPGDDRPVLVELCQSDLPACGALDGYVADPAVQAALANVHFVRYDVKTVSGAAAYERMIGSPMSGMSTLGDVIYGYRVPVLLGFVADHEVRRLEFGPPDAGSLRILVEDLAALGGSEAALTARLAQSGDDANELAHAARWYDAHRRAAEALPYWTRLSQRPDVPPDLRAEAGWQIGRAARKHRPREARATTTFATTYAGTSHAFDALAIAAVLRNLTTAEVAAALRANADAVAHAAAPLQHLVYLALAAHQYDVALELAQRLVRLTQTQSGEAFGTMAEVFYYRQEAAAAIGAGERAVALSPDSSRLRADLARYRRSDGAPSPIVEHLRREGLRVLPRFYGDGD